MLSRSYYSGVAIILQRVLEDSFKVRIREKQTFNYTFKAYTNNISFSSDCSLYFLRIY